jgi:hypothetical protein
MAHGLPRALHSGINLGDTRMRLTLASTLACRMAACLTLLALPLGASAVSPSQPAPPIELMGLDGTRLTSTILSQKWTILEWTNPGCPFVQKHYQAGNMQATQAAAKKAGFQWVQINSTNPGHGDFRSPTAMKAWNAEMKAVVSHATLDTEGKTGRAYSAKTTPQMIIINPQGVVVYNGAIDSIRSPDPADIPKARNHVLQAMADIQAGRPIAEPQTTPYGCSVKY